MNFRLNRNFPVFEDGWTIIELSPRRNLLWTPYKTQADLPDTSMACSTYFAG